MGGTLIELLSFGSVFDVFIYVSQLLSTNFFFWESKFLIENLHLVAWTNTISFLLTGTTLAWKLLQNILDPELIRFLLEVMQFMRQKNI